MEPEVLLLDEPTNGLDQSHYDRLVGILHALPKAMIIVSHDMPFLADLATRALVLREGKLLMGTIHRHPHVHDHVHIHADV
jgi:cobalt/nickel transport system ATP-binding protein